MRRIFYYILFQIRLGYVSSFRKKLFLYAISDKLKFIGEKVEIHYTVEIRNPENIEINSNSNINHGCELYGGGGISIGSGTMIAYNTLVFSDYRDFKGILPLKHPDRLSKRVKRFVRIGNDVWIGANVIILPGVEIGNHAVVAAGSVVTKSVREWEIIAGNPAKSIGFRND
jgi:acetyltransferase-like isoleucine patch superfamily enzyme